MSIKYKIDLTLMIICKKTNNIILWLEILECKNLR